MTYVMISPRYQLILARTDHPTILLPVGLYKPSWQYYPNIGASRFFLFIYTCFTKISSECLLFFSPIFLCIDVSVVDLFISLFPWRCVVQLLYIYSILLLSLSSFYLTLPPHLSLSPPSLSLSLGRIG